MSDYPNTGKLMKTKEKKFPKSPDYWGELVMEKDLVRQLLEEAKGEVTIKLDGWVRQSQSGSFLSLKVNTWKPKEKQESRMPEL